MKILNKLKQTMEIKSEHQSILGGMTNGKWVDKKKIPGFSRVPLSQIDDFLSQLVENGVLEEKKTVKNVRKETEHKHYKNERW